MPTKTSDEKKTGSKKPASKQNGTTMNEEKIFDIEVQNDGTTYTGWVNPSDKLNDDGFPASFHVVLNRTSMGYLTLNHGKWSADEQRPAELIEAVGEQISRYYQSDQAH